MGQSETSAFDINAVNALWDALLDAWHQMEPPTIEKAEEVLAGLEPYLHVEPPSRGQSGA
jgi:hypothetical protein